MNNYNIVYENHGKYSAVVYPTSYFNPIENIQDISEELSGKLEIGSYVLFDLLLSNGDNFNRFAEAVFDGSEIKVGSISITSIPGNEIQGLNRYYKGRTKILSQSVLSSKERFKFATMK